MVARLSFLNDSLGSLQFAVRSRPWRRSRRLFAATDHGLVHERHQEGSCLFPPVSQLGYMFLACGVGAYAAGIFSFELTHRLFQGASLPWEPEASSHAMSGDRTCGRWGAEDKIPKTYWTFLIADAGYLGDHLRLRLLLLRTKFPLGRLFISGALRGIRSIWGIGVAAAAMTAFYMFRLL